MAFSTGVAAGYYGLPLGTEFIQIGGKAVPIKQLKGTAQRGLFFLNDGPTGYVIKTRQQTQREAYEASRPAPASAPLPRPVVSCFDPGSPSGDYSATTDIFNDWK